MTDNQAELVAQAIEAADEKFVAEYPGCSVVARASPRWSEALALAAIAALREQDSEA